MPTDHKKIAKIGSKKNNKNFQIFLRSTKLAVINNTKKARPIAPIEKIFVIVPRDSLIRLHSLKSPIAATKMNRI
ncbi:hypothetical protein SDC9_108084 [bioreactor metagenome]|uniref:Uncharacterized protein n=1 Tax=bioreactor metagenome TaxID=1076179 RepID=A0A645B747_9ZZZZ